MWGWLCAGSAIVALIGWILSRGGLYRRLFADAHFVEVARGVDRLKDAALERVIVSDEDEVASPADRRTLVTSAGLALLYTVRAVEGRFVHHYSVSVAGRYTAHAVGETFTLFVAKLLGLPFEALALGVGRSTVHHAEFRLSAGEQAEFAARPVPVVSAAEVAVFRSEWVEASKRLRWERLEVGPPPQDLSSE
jgi:hypothetical protein